MGGHSLAIVQRYPQCKVYASDRDPEIVRLFHEENRNFPLYSRIKLKKANFAKNPFKKNSPFDFILLDLGLSSLHLDIFSRGMSYRKNDVLDMRFDQTEGMPVHHWLNQASEKDISDILFRYGEEKLSRKIANLIVHQRTEEKIRYVDDFKKICRKVYLRTGKLNYKKHTGRHPYVKSLQALRIFANQELEHLKSALDFLPCLLKKGGCLFIISFHSLEDRLVKNSFKKWSSKEKGFELLSKKPIIPDTEEVSLNSRARSAKMRVLKRAVG